MTACASKQSVTDFSWHVDACLQARANVQIGEANFQVPRLAHKDSQQFSETRSMGAGMSPVTSNASSPGAAHGMTHYTDVSPDAIKRMCDLLCCTYEDPASFVPHLNYSCVEDVC
jgi:hypothetical protein